MLQGAVGTASTAETHLSHASSVSHGCRQRQQWQAGVLAATAICGAGRCADSFVQAGAAFVTWAL